MMFHKVAAGKSHKAETGLCNLPTKTLTHTICHQHPPPHFIRNTHLYNPPPPML